MRILFVYDAVYPYIVGGAEKRIFEIARRLSMKHEVHIAGMKCWEGKSSFTDKNIHYHGICPAMSLYAKGGKRSFFEPFYFSFYLFFFLARHSFDVIDCGNFPYLSCIVAKFVCLFRRIPLVITWHEIWGEKHWLEYTGKIGLLGYCIEKLAVHQTPYNVCVSKFTASRLLEYFKVSKSSVIPNGVEYGFLRGIEVSKPGDGYKYITYAGRLVEHKHVEWLIESLPEVIKAIPKLKVNIVGDGPEKEILVNLVHKHGLDNYVVFHGFVKDARELLSVVKSADVFVLPSTREGMGIILVECMGVGTAIIAVDAQLSAAGTIVTNNYDGILVKESARQDLSKAIVSVLNDDRKRKELVENGYKTAEKYDWDRYIVPAVENYYSDVVRDYRNK